MTEDYPFFPYSEMRCHCGECKGVMNPDFMAKLIHMRAELGFPFRVASGYRCADYNDAISHSGRNGPHTTGRAVDIQISGKQAYALLESAQKAGMTGIGIAQKGAHESRFIHLDDLETKTRPWVWSY